MPGDTVRIKWSTNNSFVNEAVKIEVTYKHYDSTYSSSYIEDWIVVVSSLLVWHQWMKQPTIPKKMVRRSHVAVQWLMRFVAEVAPRPSGMGNNTIKTHLVLHLCEDILDHGVPENVNSLYAESAHIPLAKITTRNSQKRAACFFHKTSSPSVG